MKGYVAMHLSDEDVADFRLMLTLGLSCPVAHLIFIMKGYVAMHPLDEDVADFRLMLTLGLSCPVAHLTFITHTFKLC